MTTFHPRWTRTIGGVWLAAGVAFLLAGVVVVVDTHSLLRWEFAAGFVLAAVGLALWRREIRVDDLGIEQLAGWKRSRYLWSAVDRVAVGESGVRGGPVTIWHTGSDRPEVLGGSWGTTRHQRAEIAACIDQGTARFDVAVTTDTTAPDDVDAGRDDPDRVSPGAQPGSGS